MTNNRVRQFFDSTWAKLAELGTSVVGSIGITTVLCLIPIVIATTAAVDFANATRIKASLQAAVDAAVLAAATSLASGQSDAKKQEIARQTFYANLSPKLLAAFPGKVQTAVSFPTRQIRMTAQADTNQLLTSLITDSMKIRVEATAMVDKGPDLCILVLNHTAWKALDVQGTTNLSAQGCAVHVNSGHAEGMRQAGTSTATADAFGVHGNYSGSNFVPKPQPYRMREEDPLETQFAADLAASDLTTCKEDVPLKVKNTTLTPGVYCGGLTILGGTVTMDPGLYVFRDGEFTVQAGGTLQGSGVTILLTGLNTTRFESMAGASLQISPPKSGKFAGLIIAQDPISVPLKANIIRGGGNVNMEGIIYFPKQPLIISGSGVIGADTPYFGIVADTLSLEGNGTLELRFGADYAATGLPRLPESNEVIRLVK